MDIITCHGLAEFLPDELCVKLYRNAYQSLAEGGVFICSNLKRHKMTAWLFDELAELRAQYRDRDTLRNVISQTEFDHTQLYGDDVGWLTMVLATKQRGALNSRAS